MSKLTLWKMDASPPANAVRVLASILGLKLEVIDMDFANLEHKSPEFLKINPLGTLPVLRDGDFILTDSHAQMKYLLSKYGGELSERLYPSDIYARAIVDQSLFMDAAVLFVRVKVVALPAIFEGLKAPTDRHIKDIEAGYEVVESYIGNKEYIAADHLTIADICVGSTIAGTTPIHKLDKNKFPITSAWLDHLYEIPQFNKYVTVGVQKWGAVLDKAWAKNNSKQI